MTQQYIKVCKSKRAFSNELLVYQSAYPNKSELIVIGKPNTLVLTEVKGIPYLDVQDFSDDMIAKLARAISRFHNLVKVEGKVLCHWDNQPRNILWNDKEKKFYLIDFEDLRLAFPESDIAHLFLFWAEVMDYNQFSESVRKFVDNYQGKRILNWETWSLAARNSMHRFDRRRWKYHKLEKRDNSDRLKNRKLLLTLSCHILD